MVSSEKSLISTLIALHLAAISASSLPDPRELKLVRAADGTPPQDAIARTVTPALDAAVAVLIPLEAHVFRATAPIRALTRPYVQAGLQQKWNMFANPFAADQYVRVRYHVGSSVQPGRIRLFQELVLPDQREDQPRLVHKFRDKAILHAFETLSVRRVDHPDAVADLNPIAAYFARRFKAVYLAQDEMVLATEVWFGAAPIPATGHRLTDAQLQQRSAVIERYREGPMEVPGPVMRLEEGALQSESDIVWRLDSVQGR
jgi:hypothetical protein